MIQRRKSMDMNSDFVHCNMATRKPRASRTRSTRTYENGVRRGSIPYNRTNTNTNNSLSNQKPRNSNDFSIEAVRSPAIPEHYTPNELSHFSATRFTRRNAVPVVEGVSPWMKILLRIPSLVYFTRCR